MKITDTGCYLPTYIFISSIKDILKICPDRTSYLVQFILPILLEKINFKSSAIFQFEKCTNSNYCQEFTENVPIIIFMNNLSNKAKEDNSDSVRLLLRIPEMVSISKVYAEKSCYQNIHFNSY